MPRNIVEYMKCQRYKDEEVPNGERYLIMLTGAYGQDQQSMKKQIKESLKFSEFGLPCDIALVSLSRIGAGERRPLITSCVILSQAKQYNDISIQRLLNTMDQVQDDGYVINRIITAGPSRGAYVSIGAAFQAKTPPLAAIGITPVMAAKYFSGVRIPLLSSKDIPWLTNPLNTDLLNMQNLFDKMNKERRDKPPVKIIMYHGNEDKGTTNKHKRDMTGMAASTTGGYGKVLPWRYHSFFDSNLFQYVLDKIKSESYGGNEDTKNEEDTKHQKFEAVKDYLEYIYRANNRNSINSIYEDGYTYLNISIYYSSKIDRYISAYIEFLDIKSMKNIKNTKDVIRVLLKNGARIDVMDIYHITPLWQSVFKKRADITKVLLEKGAKPTEALFQHIVDYKLTDISRVFIKTGVVNDIKESLRQAIKKIAVNEYEMIEKYIKDEDIANPDPNLDAFKFGISDQENEARPNSAYRGIGMEVSRVDGVDGVDGGLLIHNIYSPRVLRFSIYNQNGFISQAQQLSQEQQQNLKNEIITRVQIDGEMYETHSFDDQKIASIFHKKNSKVVFEVSNGVTYCCNNTKNQSAIFAPHPKLSNNGRRNFSALSEILKFEPSLAKTLIKEVIELIKNVIKKMLPTSQFPSTKPRTNSKTILKLHDKDLGSRYITMT